MMLELIEPVKSLETLLFLTNSRALASLIRM